MKQLTEWLIAISKEADGLFSDPLVDWIVVVIAASLIAGLLLLKAALLKRIPVWLYTGSVLVSLFAVDWWTRELDLFWGYLVVLVLFQHRIPKEHTCLSTPLFFAVYEGVQWTMGWKEAGWVQTFGEALAFGLVGWVGCRLQQAASEVKQIKGENRRLLKKVDEAHSRLLQYIDELEETSRRDYLTGLYNFSGFQEQVSKSVSRCTGGQGYHVVCVDLVGFQQVNMREGIDAGDQILVRIARQLKRGLPPYAQVARYGDQFAVGITGDDAAFRKCLEIVEQVIGGLRVERSLVNYCMGTASYPNEANSASELIRLAERRLSIEQRRERHKEEERQRHLEKLSAVGQLAAGLAHEIRNPLTSIRGFIQISAAESPEVKKWESIILPEIDRINDLLKQFLHLSESRPIRFTLFNLDRLIDDVLQLLHPKAILMGHELKFQSSDSPVIIEADAEQLKQVMINLIQNGLESLHDKGCIWIQWKELQDRISIRVQDNGSGIQPEHMSRIFDPFFTTKGDGTGMGLSICHRIISDHGGQIHVTSQPGRGSTFNIYLPIRQSARQGSGTTRGEMSPVELSREPVTERGDMIHSL